MNRLPVLITALMITAVLFAGCSANGVYLPEDDLLNGEWSVTSLGIDNEPLQGKVTFRFSTDPNTISGRAACNMFTAGYNLGEKSITFDAAASTKMMCPDIATETAFFSALRKITSYTLTEGKLVFFEGNVPLITAVKIQ